MIDWLARLLGIARNVPDDGDGDDPERTTIEYLQEQRRAATREASRLREIRLRLERNSVPFTGERRTP